MIQRQSVLVPIGAVYQTGTVSGFDCYWTGAAPVPQKGDRVEVSMNSLGAGTVIGHFVAKGEAGNQYLGVTVRLEAPPKWYVKQNEHAPANVFGSELNDIRR